MGVGVEEATLQQLLKAAIHPHFHHVVWINAQLSNGIQIGELDAVDPFHREDAAAGGIPVDGGDGNSRVVPMQRGKSFRVGCLVEVIHLFEDAPPKFIDQGDEIAADQADVAVQPRGDIAHDVEIQGDLFPKPWSLNFHRHLGATLQDTLMHLTEGGR